MSEEMEPEDVKPFDPEVLVWTSPSKLVVSHRWLINNIDCIKNCYQKAVRSSGFMSISNMTFCLQARLKGDSLVLALLKDSGPSISVIATDCKFSIYSGNSLNSDTSDLSLSLADHKIAHNHSNPGVSIPLTKVCENSLSVKFEGIVLSEDYKQFSVINPSPIQWPFEWMVKMFDEKSYSDAQIQVGEEVFLVHRVILASASPVFHAMFESEMQERSGIIKISDFDSDVVSDLLAFIYTSEAPNLVTLAKELLLAADKYDVQSLAVACMEHLGDELTPDNVAEILLLAGNLQSAKRLKNICVKYIQDDFDSVSKSQSWKLLEETSNDNIILDAISSVPTQYSSSKIVKQDFSFQWVISNCKKLQAGSATVQGPKIYSYNLPCPLSISLSFPDSNLVIEHKEYYEPRKLKYSNVWVCNCSVTIPEQSSVKMPDQKLIHSYWSKRMFHSTKFQLSIPTLTADDTLTLYIDGFLNFNDEEYTHKTGFEKYISGNNQHKLDLLLQNETFSDLAIKVNGTHFRLHKAILYSASENFEEILEDENSSQVIELHDVNPEDVSDLIRYIYSGTLPNVRVKAKNILMLADRFCLEHLINVCVFELTKTFSPTNVADFLSLASKMKFGKEILTNSCANFIKMNSIDVYRSESWKNLKKSSAVKIAVEIAKITLAAQNNY